MSTARKFSAALIVGATLAAQMIVGPSAVARPLHYVPMSDGTNIAISVHWPPGYDEASAVAAGGLPVVFEMSGYDGASADGRTLAGDVEDAIVEAGFPQAAGQFPLTGDSTQNTRMFMDDYIVVHASLRGTGCSEGEFDLFSSRSSRDGYELIQWIDEQAWSDGRIGITGHSYSGLTGFLVAATQPPALDAVVVSGLIDDLYRGIVYMGGVSNYGFPVIWTGGVRNLYDLGGGTAPALVRDQDLRCAQNLTTHRRTVTNDPVVQGLSDTDNDWFRARSLIEVADRIEVPIHIWGAHQDQETGPRGPTHLWEALRPGLPKRLVIGNTNHDGWRSIPQVVADKVAWMDHWVLDEDHGFGTLADAHRSVEVLFEIHDETVDGVARGVATHSLSSTDFPLPESAWTTWYLDEGGSLSESPAVNDGSSTYVSGTLRHSWNYQAGPTVGAPVTTDRDSIPDQTAYRGPIFGEDVAVAGPATATLWLSSSEPDTELFVHVIDEAPNGARTYIQRGMLRASHRAIDPVRSDAVLIDGEPVIYRPHRPHTNPQPVMPGAVTEYLVEIFPFAHVFRAGHRLSIEIKAPPAADSYYIYVPKRLPGAINTVMHGPGYPSRVMLPVVDLHGADLGPEIACGRQKHVRCIAAPEIG